MGDASRFVIAALDLGRRFGALVCWWTQDQFAAALDAAGFVDMRRSATRTPGSPPPGGPDGAAADPRAHGYSSDDETLGGTMADEVEVGPAAELVPGVVLRAGRYAVGNADGELFAVTRHCRHLRGDLAGGSIDPDGCLVCPWHGAAYDVSTGEMTRGPQGIFAKIPGLGAGFRLLTKVLPLGRGEVVERDGTLFVR